MAKKDKVHWKLGKEMEKESEAKINGKRLKFGFVDFAGFVDSHVFQSVVDGLWHERISPNLLYQRNRNGQCLFCEENVGGST